MHKSVLPTCRPASIFMFLSLAFGSIIIFANPPLRGPDEIAHFLRIYSYTRGELLPVTEIKSRKGIFVSPGLYNQLYFFKTAGEVFAKSAEEGMRYGHIMAEYSRLAVALPVAAVFIAALVDCELPRGVPAAIAIAGSMIAGITTVEAVLRPHW